MIERRGRLVEEQQFGALGQRAGDDHALFFAAAQRRERPFFERACAGGGERAPRDREVLGPFERERAQMREASHQHDLQHGEIERRMRFLGT